MTDQIEETSKAEAPAGDDIFALFGTSENEAENGKWFKLGPKLRVKVRRFTSKKSRKVREALEAPYRTARGGVAKIPAEALEELTNEHLAAGILADWDGMNDSAGKPIKYSKDAAMALFEKLPDFRDAIAGLAIDIDNFRAETKEADEGN